MTTTNENEAISVDEERQRDATTEQTDGDANGQVDSAAERHRPPTSRP